MKYGLSKTGIEKICSVFASFGAIEKAVLYGSRAKGNFKTGSDIDLTLYGEALTSDLCSTIASALDDQLLPYTIDLSVFEDLNHVKLREHIERVGVIFYERNSAAAHPGTAMKKGWITTQLSDVAAVQSGAGFPDRYQGEADSEIPFYKVSDMNIVGNERAMVYENNSITEEVRRELGAFLFPKGSTLFPKIGGAIATNKKRLTTRDCCVDNNVMGVIPRPGRIDSEFLFYFFLAHDLSEFANEAHLPSIRKTVVEGWPIALPESLAEQQRIVGILDEAFEGIATAKANAEKNLQNARALFESHLQSVFTQRGDGWVEKTIEQICSKITDGEHLRPKVTSSGIPFLSAKDVLDKGVVFDDSLFISEEDAVKFRKRCNPEEGDVLIVSRGATVGRTCIVSTNRTFCLLGSVILLKIGGMLTSRFVSYALKSPGIRNQLMTASEAAAQQAIYLRDIKRLIIGFPSLSEQEAFVRQLDSLASETQRLATIYERKLAALDDLKKSLLHQAFSGQL